MSSSSRFLLDPAPGGLELVQDLVNTRPVAPYGVRDLLGTVADAQRLTTGVVRAWKEQSGATAGVRRITSADLPALRRLRSDVERQLTRQGRGGVRPVTATLSVDATGTVRLQPAGAGVRWLASA